MKGKFAELVAGDVPVLVDFSAEWCGPCKQMVPILNQLKQKMGDQLKIVKIDVDRNQALASQFQVMSVPTLMLFRQGKTVWRKSGVLPAQELERMIQTTR